MNPRIQHATIRNAWIGVVLVTLSSTVVYAATPTALPTPTTNATVKPNVVQPLKPPDSKPVLRPAARTPASFTRDIPLSEAIEILENCTTPPLPIVVLWRDLDGAGVYHDTPIGIDGIPGLRLSQYLDMLVLSLSAGASTEIGYRVHRGVIMIASTSALPVSKQITRVYDIRDLTSPPSNPFPMMGTGSSYMSGGGYGMTGLGGFPGAAGGVTRTGPYRSR